MFTNNMVNSKNVHSMYVWEAIYTTFLFVFASDIVSKLPMEENGEITELSTIKRRQMETQDLGPYKVENIEDSGSEYEDEKQRQEHTRQEQTY